MSSLDTVKCPKCGTTKSFHLGGYGFAFNPNTMCSCGYTFDNVANTISSIDPDAPPPSLGELVKQNLIKDSTLGDIADTVADLWLNPGTRNQQNEISAAFTSRTTLEAASLALLVNNRLPPDQRTAFSAYLFRIAK